MSNDVRGRDPMSRAEWMQQRAALLQRRYDELHAPVYDSQYADLSPVGLKLVATLLERCPPGGVVLDAGRGTGIWWPTILSRGLQVVGVDQSAGMLQRASAKHPQVEVHVRHLDELAFDRDFDAAICVDVLEMVFPEKWPLALGGLARAVREGSLIYLTIEKPPGDLAEVFMAAQRAGWPVQVGEYVTEHVYHFYPSDGSGRRVA